MCKKTVIVLTLFAIMSLIYNTAYGMSVNLTVVQINEAIKYGHTNKRTSPKDFAEPWIVRLDEKSGWATLWTPYHNVAFKAKKAAVERRELSQREILRALHIKESLTFVVSVFGEYMEFARGYNAILYSEGKAVYPIYSYFPEFAEPSSFYPEEPAFVAGCVYKFSIEDINQNSEVRLFVTSPEGKEHEFVFDLVNVK
ncbi:MAG: hypothetical protein ACUZ8N_06770 [Candidatus Scalindua sp.]